MDKLSRGFQLAKRASTFSDVPRIKIGASIFYKRRLVSIGYNSLRVSRMQSEYNKYRDFDPDSAVNSVHAEMMALSTIRYDIESGVLNPDKLSIFVYRELSDGRLALSKPCEACEAALRHYGIRKVYYTTYGSFVNEYYT